MKTINIKETLELAIQNHKENNFEIAAKLYKEILNIDPDHFKSIHLLGTLSAQIKNFNQAKKFLEKAIEIKNDYSETHYNLGNTLIELGEIQKAINCFEKVIQINPGNADAHNNLGNLLKELGKIHDAERCYKKVIQINPNYANAYNNLGTIFQKNKDFQEAIRLYEKTIQLNPNFASPHNNLGLIFYELQEYQKAINSYEKAIDIQPNYADAYINLGAVFKTLGEFKKAISCYQKAINIQPNYAEAHNNLGVVFKALGEFKKAISCYQKAINFKHNYAPAYNNMLFALLYMEKTDSKYYLSKTKEFRSSLKPINDNLLIKYQFNTKPKKIKIGFVSGDFREHPVGFFLLDTLKHLKNNDLELIAYSNSQIEDSLSIKLKSHFTNWHEIERQSNMDVINTIRKDGIHILVDLSGHTEKNRLPIFINKPAPIQVSWAGFPASTGISEVDYIIGDPYVTPKDNVDHFIEKIFRLPNMWVCFSVPEFEVKINELPAIKNGYITFGCFNNLSKVNNEAIVLWSKILKAIPKSKIFLKTKQLIDPYVKEKIINNFKKNNINSNSLILEGSSPRNKLLATYNKVDIALDTFPYSGGVTSLEAIWMGVPVLTKKGFRFVSHTTESINHNCGMSDWIASDENEYVKKAIKFSTNLEQLSEINKSLRQTALESPLFNSLLFAKQLNSALWKMWNNFISKKGT